MILPDYLPVIYNTLSTTNSVTQTTKENNNPNNHATYAFVGSKIKLFSTNVLNVHTNPQPIMTEILNSNADIIVCQEYSFIWLKMFQINKIYSKYPFFIEKVRKDGFGTAIFSRLKLIDAKIFYIDSFSYSQATIEVRNDNSNRKIIDDDDHTHANHDSYSCNYIQLFNLHPPPPRVSKDGNYIKYFNNNWQQLYDKVSNWIYLNSKRDIKHGLVLIGDFNVTQYNYWIQRLKYDLKLNCAHTKCNRGYATTFPNGFFLLPPIRLDHCFINSNIHCHNIFEGNGKGSDHKPLVVTLQFKN